MTTSFGRTSLIADLVLVVQRRHRHRRAADEHRLEYRVRRRSAGPADRHLDRAQRRRALLGRHLAGDRPPRRARASPGSLAQVEVVDLHDDAVDLVLEVVALRLHPRAPIEHRVEAAHRDGLGGGRKPRVAERLERRGLGSRREPAARAAPRARRAGRRRTRAGATRSPRGPSGAAIPPRRCAGSRTAAAPRAPGARSASRRRPAAGRSRRGPPDRRRRPVDVASASRHRRDRRDVRGDVLADDAVASRGGLGERAALVGDGHREAVDLRLNGERDVVEDVEAEHARQGARTSGGARRRRTRCRGSSSRRDAHWRELRARGARRRGSVGDSTAASSGCCRLQAAKLDDERVVVGVGDRRLVVDEVGLVVPAICSRSSATRRVAVASRDRAHARRATVAAPTTRSGSAAS